MFDARAGWRLRWYTSIFDADKVAGRRFDLALIVLILLSIAVVMADSVQALRCPYGYLGNALAASGRKILVFLLTVMRAVLILGTVM